MGKFKHILSLAVAIAVFATNSLPFNTSAEELTPPAQQQIVQPTGGFIPVHGVEISTEESAKIPVYTPPKSATPKFLMRSFSFPTTPTYNSTYGYDQLTSTQQTVYDNLKAMADNFQTSGEATEITIDTDIFLSTPDVIYTGLATIDNNGEEEVKEISKIAKALIYDNPKYFWIYNNGFFYETNSNTISLWVDDNLAYATERSDKWDVIETEINGYLNEVKDLNTNFEAELYLHDKIIRDVDYAFMVDENGDYVLDGEGDKIASAANIHHTIEGVFTDVDYVVCEGYAKAFNLLMNACDIPTIFVVSGGHAFNMVQLEGNWYWIDLTWDDYPQPNGNPVSYDWFNDYDAHFFDGNQNGTIDITETDLYDYNHAPCTPDTPNDWLYALPEPRATTNYEPEQPTKPTITTDLSDTASVEIGKEITLTIEATGNINDHGIVEYAWFKDENFIDGTNSPSFTITNAKDTDAGKYEVKVLNTLNFTTVDSWSNDCTLSVTPEQPATPTFTTDLQVNKSAAVGDNVTLSVVATATNGTLTYKWFKGTSEISGATSDSYTIANAQTSDSDEYKVEVTNTLNSNTATATSEICNLTVSEAAPTTYTATVTDGTGGGDFAADKTVTITANAAPSGKVFDKWTTSSASVTFDNATSATTTFTMPANDVTVTATYKNAPVTTYTATVTNGTGDGDFAQGAPVTITANTAPSGKVFDKWTTTDSVTFADATSASTTFTMPANDVTVTATYKNAPTPKPTPTPAPDPDPEPTPEPDVQINDEIKSETPKDVKVVKIANNEFSGIDVEIALTKASDEQKEALKEMTTEEIKKEIKKVTDVIATVNTTKVTEKAKEKIEEVKKALPDKAKVMAINFTKHATFAFPVQVSVDVDKTDYPAGTYHLYYYNDETGEIEDCGDALVDANGVASFTISHCSDYFISSEIVDLETANAEITVKTADSSDKNPNTGNAIPATLIITSIATAYIVTKKKFNK